MTIVSFVAIPSALKTTAAADQESRCRGSWARMAASKVARYHIAISDSDRAEM